MAGLSSVDMVINQKDALISGVATVTSLFGQKDLYHFDGAVNGDVVQARHYKGRSFFGKVVGPDRIRGVLTLKSGMKLKLSAKRVSH